MIELMNREMVWYSMTTDLWSSKQMTSLLAITVPILSDDFKMYSLVIEVCPFDKGQHSGEYCMSNFHHKL